MANRRMFAKNIIDSDIFLDMPLSTQALYFHLSMRADDDGFINNPKKIMRMIGASQDELTVLLGKQFIISFESGVVIIKHWKIHNYIRKDRYTPTLHNKEKQLLSENENGSYTLERTSNINDKMVTISSGMTSGMTSGQPVVNQMDTQDRLGKVRLGKDKKEYIKYNEIFNYYIKKDNTISHQSINKSMKTGIKLAVDELSLNLNDIKMIIDKHDELIKLSSSSKFPIKARRLDILFGQHTSNIKNAPLLCQEYLEGGKKSEYLKDLKTKKNKPINGRGGMKKVGL